MVSGLAVAIFLFWGIGFNLNEVAAFKPLFSSGSFTHREITQFAMLRKTAEVCRDIAIAQGRDFTLPVRKIHGREPNNDNYKIIITNSNLSDTVKN